MLGAVIFLFRVSGRAGAEPPVDNAVRGHVVPGVPNVSGALGEQPAGGKHSAHSNVGV
jgi:hypothetical protein